MAAELDYSMGKAAYAGRLPAWHNEGTVFDGAVTRLAAMELACQLYTVEKRRTQMRVPGVIEGQPERYVDTGAYITWRTDTNRELGVVEHGYHVVQNQEAFEIFDPLLDEGVASIETAGVLREGADAWMLLSLDLGKFGPMTRDVFASEIKPYLLVANNFNGRRGILCACTDIRVVCANTLGGAERAGLKDQVIVRHTKESRARLVEAAKQLWGDIVEKHEAIARAYEKLMAIHLTRADFQRLVVDACADDPRKLKDFNPDAKLAELVVTRYERKRDRLFQLWTEGTGHTGEPTGWYAYNAAAEALDHEKELFPVRSGTFRTASLLDGRLKQTKSDVLANLMRFARN